MADPRDDSGTNSLPREDQTTSQDGKGPDPDLSPEEMEDAEGAWLDDKDSPEERALPTPPKLEGEGLQPSTREGEEKPLSAQEIKQGSEEFLQLIDDLLQQEMGENGKTS